MSAKHTRHSKIPLEATLTSRGQKGVEKSNTEITHLIDVSVKLTMDTTLGSSLFILAQHEPIPCYSKPILCFKSCLERPLGISTSLWSSLLQLSR